jgi:hypothetical protein
LLLFQLVLVKLSAEQKTVKLLWVAYLSYQLLLFQLVLVKLSAVQKTVKLLWVAYLSFI